MILLRKSEINLIKDRLKNYPVVALLGPRQCGKTTLSQQFAQQTKSPVTFFDLENPRDLKKLDDPLLTLEDVKGLIIIDEIQRKPDFFPVLRVMADRPEGKKYLILGSASRDLIKQSSESLAGRVSYLEIGGFSLGHIAPERSQRLWIRGGFPKSFLASSEKTSYQWRLDFIATFLERDIPQLGLQIPAKSLGRFWNMLAHYHGQIFNASEIGNSLGISDHTAQRYLDLLSGTFMVRQLKPWHYNTKKRLVKRPKIYFRDSGILHALLSLEEKNDVLSHPKLGFSWEGFALNEVIHQLQIKEEGAYFWAVHSGADIDLVFERKGKLYGVEVKYSQAPGLTPSIRSALQELSLAHVWIVYPGKENYSINAKVSALSINHLTFSFA